MPIVDIAVSLNYAGTSAFTRAFRRWSGATPPPGEQRSSTINHLSRCPFPVRVRRHTE
ncbi:MAG: hypothetical protein R3F36_07470 [Candidatus Competibacteraceae bacterium]